MLLSTKEASERLDVSVRRVRELAAKGTLESVGDGSRLYVTEESVRRFQSRIRRPGRLFSPRIAFAALYVLSSEEPGWLKAAEKYRLKRKLCMMDAPRLLELCSRRASTHDFWCRDSRLNRVSQSIRISSATGGLAEKFDLTESPNVEGYIPEEVLPDDYMGKTPLGFSANECEASCHIIHATGRRTYADRCLCGRSRRIIGCS